MNEAKLHEQISSQMHRLAFRYGVACRERELANNHRIEFELRTIEFRTTKNPASEYFDLTKSVVRSVIVIIDTMICSIDTGEFVAMHFHRALRSLMENRSFRHVSANEE